MEQLSGIDSAFAIYPMKPTPQRFCEWHGTSCNSPIFLTSSGSAGYAIRNLNTSGRNPVIWHATGYCTNGAWVYFDHPDVAGAYEAIATAKDAPLACRAVAGATTSQSYLVGTNLGNINFALLAFV